MMRKRTLPPPKPYKGEKNLTLMTLEKLRERRVVSRQFIVELCKNPSVKQTERDLIYTVLSRFSPYSKIPVEKFAREVKKELIPLKGKDMNTERHGYTVLDHKLRGDVQQYKEIVYQSPVPTRAGRTHFNNSNYAQEAPTPRKYFAHTRIEDMADSVTRRIIEVQSDLFQKKGLDSYEEVEMKSGIPSELKEEYRALLKIPYYNLNLKEMGRLAEIKAIGMRNRKEELSKLEPYRNSWQERIIREEIRQAALTDKSRLLFPTGKTAIKIEGLERRVQNVFHLKESNTELVAEDLKEGKIIRYNGGHWTICTVYENGKFTAAPHDIHHVMQRELSSPDPAIQMVGRGWK